MVKIRNNSKKVLFVVLFALVGVGMLVLTRAQSNNVVFEVETATRTNGISRTDSTASGGSYVEFAGEESKSCEYTNPNNPYDDPNQLYDGTHGRRNVSSAPVPIGYPTPLNTGICGVGMTETDLIAYTGPSTITQDNTVIEGVISGRIIIQANNVTIKNSQLTSSSNYVIQQAAGFSGLLIEDSRIRSLGTSVSGNIAIYTQGTNVTIRRINISGGRVGLYVGSNTVVEDSYIVSGAYATPGSHNEATYVRKGSNIQFRRNSIIAGWKYGTAAMTFLAKSGAGGGPISDVIIENNYLSGGGYTVFADATDYSFTNLDVINNRFEQDSWQYGAMAGSAPFNKTGNTFITSP